VIAKLLGRTPRQVSYHYQNHLDPTIVWIEASESTGTKARRNRDVTEYIFRRYLKLKLDVSFA
jgi:hypothetical protein